MSCRVFPLTVQKFEHEQIQLFLSIQFSYNNKLSSSLDMMYKLFSKLLKSPWKDSEGFEIFKITNFERFRNFYGFSSETIGRKFPQTTLGSKNL